MRKLSGNYLQFKQWWN